MNSLDFQIKSFGEFEGVFTFHFEGGFGEASEVDEQSQGRLAGGDDAGDVVGVDMSDVALVEAIENGGGSADEVRSIFHEAKKLAHFAAHFQREVVELPAGLIREFCGIREGLVDAILSRTEWHFSEKQMMRLDVRGELVLVRLFGITPKRATELARKQLNGKEAA